MTDKTKKEKTRLDKRLEARKRNKWKRGVETLDEYIARKLKAKGKPKRKPKTITDIYELSDNKYTETLAYRIEKFRGPPVGNPIQNFWFKNRRDEITVATETDDPLLASSVMHYSTLDIGDNTFVDTQIQYGFDENTDYTYKIYQYVLVVGIKYKMRDLRITRQIGTTATGLHCLEFYIPDSGHTVDQLY